MNLPNARGWVAWVGREHFAGYEIHLARPAADGWDVAVGIDDGRLRFEFVPEGQSTPSLLALPRGAEVALAEAFADLTPDAEWRARAEERQVALDRETARVDRILDRRLEP